MTNRRKKRASGFAAVEMTIITPFLLLLVGAVIEITSYLQANSIMIGVGREAANLVARTSVNTPEEIMELVAKTTGDVDLASNGAMFITLVTGQQDKDPYINEQYKWISSSLSQESETWDSCGGWSNGQCLLSSPRPTISDFPVSLDPNESVYVVEVHYFYTPLTSFAYDTGFVISDITYL